MKLILSTNSHWQPRLRSSQRSAHKETFWRSWKKESSIMEFTVSQTAQFGCRGLEAELALEFVLLICCYFNYKVTREPNNSWCWLTKVPPLLYSLLLLSLRSGSRLLWSGQKRPTKESVSQTTSYTSGPLPNPPHVPCQLWLGLWWLGKKEYHSQPQLCRYSGLLDKLRVFSYNLWTHTCTIKAFLDS